MNRTLISMFVAIPLFICGCKTATVATGAQPIKILEPTKEEQVSVQIGHGIFAKAEEVIIYMNKQKIIVNHQGVLILNNVEAETELPIQPVINPTQLNEK